MGWVELWTVGRERSCMATWECPGGVYTGAYQHVILRVVQIVAADA